MTRVEAESLLALAREANLSGPDGEKWLERLAPRRGELAEAVRFLAESGDEEAAVELAANVWRVWHLKGDVPGGRLMLAAALDSGARKPSRARALALYGDGLLAFRAGAMIESSDRNATALQVARTVGDREAESRALVGLSRVALREGDYARVRSLAMEARLITRTLDPTADAAPLHMLAAGTRLAGDYDGAVGLYAESLDLSRRLGDTVGVAMELHNLAHVELHRGNVDAASRSFAECADLRSHDDPYDVAMTHLNNAALAFARGDRKGAGESLVRTRSTLHDAGIVLDPDDTFEVDWLRDRLG